MKSRPQRLSMLRSYTPADLLTLANASCGTLSIFACLTYIEDERSQQLWVAFMLLAPRSLVSAFASSNVSGELRARLRQLRRSAVRSTEVAQ